MALHLDESFFDSEAERGVISQILLTNFQVGHLLCKVLAPFVFGLFRQMSLQLAHTLPSGHFRVEALLLTRWTVEHIRKFFLLKQNRERYFEAVNLLSLKLLLLNFATFAR